MRDKMVGMRTTDLKTCIPGTKSGYKCVECGHLVSLSPSGIQRVASADMDVICHQCAPRLKDGDEVYLPKGAVDEIQAWRNRN